LQSLGITSDKTYSKRVDKAWGEFNAAYKNGKPPSHLKFVKASAEVRKAAASVNIRSIGDTIVFPVSEKGIVKIRETKHGVFIRYGSPKAETLDEIVLSKDGDHLAYGLKLAKRESSRANKKEGNTPYKYSYGSLKIHTYKTGGVEVKGFMRDVAGAKIDPLEALFDDRYSKAGNDSETLRDELDAYEIEGTKITKELVSGLQELNGTVALIRLSFR